MTSTSILSMVHEENQYLLVRQQLLTQPTTSEHARASRISSQMDDNDIHSALDPLVQSKLLTRQKRKSS